MARCGCSSTCVCSISPSACIAVSGNGSTGAPFVLAPIIDPDLGNTLTCGPDGLLVPLLPFAVDDTSCIEVSGMGTVLDPLLISPVIDPNLDNILECGIAGLFVDRNAVELTVFVGDTSCIELSGDGSPGDPLLATPVIDPDLDNILECGIAGLFVDGSNIPVAGVGDTQCIQLSGDGTVGDPLLATPVIAAVAGNILECGASGLVAGGADFKTWVTDLSTATGVSDIRAHSLTYLATLP